MRKKKSASFKSILIDTNVMLVLIAGLLDKDMLGKAKRLKAYKEDDWALLVAFTQPFQSVLTLPNILTELSNLSNSFEHPMQYYFLEHVRQNMSLLTEEYIPSLKIVEDVDFSRFGVTDTAIAHCAIQNQCPVLSDDLKLCGLLMKRGVEVVNFNHLRYRNYC